jgi:hypothetical protein
VQDTLNIRSAYIGGDPLRKNLDLEQRLVNDVKEIRSTLLSRRYQHTHDTNSHAHARQNQENH